MANIKSAQKRIDVIERNTARNKSNKSKMKTAIKKANTAIEAGEIDKAKEIMPATVSTIDKSVTKGVIHKNAANRRKSRIAKKLDSAAK